MSEDTSPVAAAKEKEPSSETRYHRAFDRIDKIVSADEYPFLVGPPGSGKTTIGEQIAERLKLPFFYAGAVESAFQLKGFKDAQGNLNKTAFVHAYENGGVFLQDEMDASDSTALVALNTAIGNRLLDMPDGTMVKMHPDFKLLGAANTTGRGATLKYTGRNALDSATLDRYTQVMVDYDTDLERFIALKLNGEAALPMLSLVHQARAAGHELNLDDSFEFSTRALVKGVKFMKVGMSLEEAFMQAAMDKLGDDNVEKVMKRMNMNLRDFEAKAGPDSIGRFLKHVNDIASRLVAYEATKVQLDEVLEQAEKTCKQAFSLAGSIGSKIQGADDMMKRLEQVQAMLKGLQQAAPVVVEAATHALESIRGAAGGPA